MALMKALSAGITQRTKLAYGVKSPFYLMMPNHFTRQTLVVMCTLTATSFQIETLLLELLFDSRLLITVLSETSLKHFLTIISFHKIAVTGLQTLNY